MSIAIGIIALLVFSVVMLITNLYKQKQILLDVASNSENLKQKLATLDTNLEQLKVDKDRADRQLIELAPFSAIVDVEAHIRELRTKYDEEMSIIRERNDAQIKNERQSAFVISTRAKEEAEALVKKAKESVKSIQDKADRDLADAAINAKRIIDQANIEAKKIASDALDARDKAELFEKTAVAMKNIIDGYGDKYIVPTHGLLDDLADDYSHTDAGSELKRARDKTRAMIANNTAADCEYVESNRRDTAINFVLDAFNGKVDTILASVKKDNFGTLEQKIRDAFQTVNFNGRAFREAKINDLYLASRLDELKWSCTTQALKERDKEEQRRIREQIREEEKAAKEYERALKEAQKEEEGLAKAMEKVRKDLESATEQQRLKYEEKLREYEQKLKEAEEKSQRALSMAQQTKTGHVYIISNIGSFGDDVVKIGLTRRLEPQDRIDELGDASVPFDFDVHALILSEDAPALEKELHRRFLNTQVNKVNSRKEFFKIPIHDLKNVIEDMGINVHWTMTSEAKEYRESLALIKKENRVA